MRGNNVDAPQLADEVIPDFFSLSQDSNATFFDSIKDGSLFKLTPEDAKGSWRKPYLFHDPFAMNQAPNRHRRCNVYTYFDQKTTPTENPPATRSALEEIKNEIQLVETWALAMWAIGLNPVILGPKDAAQHPRYKEFSKSTLIPLETKNHYARFFAWLAQGGGIFSDYRVVPTTRNMANPAIQHLRMCNFQEPATFFDDSLAFLVSHARHLRPFVAELVRGRSIKDLLNHFDLMDQHEFSYYSNRNFRSVTTGLQGTDDDEAHVPASKVLSMVNSHLKQIFLNAYPGGLHVASPEAFNLSAEVVKVVGKCPENQYVNTCPPTRDALYKLKHGRSPRASACEALPCSARARGKATNAFFQDDSIQSPFLLQKSFTVATLLHPLTALKSQHPDAYLTVDHVEQQENTQTKKLSKSIFTQNAFIEEAGIIALKDNIYQHTTDTNVLWVLPEELGTNVANKQLEWDIGFRLTGDDLTHLFSRSKEFVPVDLEPLKKRIQADLALSNYRNTGSFKRGFDKPDDVMHAVKERNKADIELWKFLQKWNKNKEVSLVNIEHQLKLLRAGAKVPLLPK